VIYESISDDNWKENFIHNTLPHNGVNSDFLYITGLNSWDNIYDVAPISNRVYLLKTKVGNFKIQFGNGISIRYVWKEGDSEPTWERNHRGFLTPIEDNSWREE
jgi:hypothetical protein